MCSSRLGFGVASNLCDANSELTVEGGLPSSLAIYLHEASRFNILWTMSRSYPVSLPMALGAGNQGPSYRLHLNGLFTLIISVSLARIHAWHS